MTVDARRIDLFRERLMRGGIAVLDGGTVRGQEPPGPGREGEAETGLPVWLGISAAEVRGGRATTIDGEDVGGLIESVPAEALDAVLVMHTDIHLVPDSLSAVRSAWPSHARRSSAGAAASARPHRGAGGARSLVGKPRLGGAFR